MQSPVQLSRGSHVRDAADAKSRVGGGGGGYRGASCGELYLLTRTFQNSGIHSRGSWWVAVKVQLMTIYILAVVFSALLCFNSISRQAGGWGCFPLISVAGRQRQADL